MYKPTLILGVIGADCHAVGNKIIASVLEPLGIDVVNLGVMVSQDEFIDAAIETGADAILVSSIYGHGEIDCMGLRDRCVERGLADILLYVGGNLVVGKREFSGSKRYSRAWALIASSSPASTLQWSLTCSKRTSAARVRSCAPAPIRPRPKS